MKQKKNICFFFYFFLVVASGSSLYTWRRAIVFVWLFPPLLLLLLLFLIHRLTVQSLFVLMAHDNILKCQYTLSNSDTSHQARKERAKQEIKKREKKKKMKPMKHTRFAKSHYSDAIMLMGLPNERNPFYPCANRISKQEKKKHENKWK